MPDYQLRGCDENGRDTGELFTTPDAGQALNMFIEGGWWKMSFTLASGERVRLVRDNDNIEIGYNVFAREKGK